MLTSLEICAGAGGQALGLERAGYHHAAAVELDPHAVQTLRLNRPEWNVVHQDVREFVPDAFRGVDLVAGGVHLFPSPGNNWARPMTATCFLQHSILSK